MGYNPRGKAKKIQVSQKPARKYCDATQCLALACIQAWAECPWWMEKWLWCFIMNHIAGHAT